MSLGNPSGSVKPRVWERGFLVNEYPFPNSWINRPARIAQIQLRANGDIGMVLRRVPDIRSGITELTDELEMSLRIIVYNRTAQTAVNITGPNAVTNLVRNSGSGGYAYTPPAAIRDQVRAAYAESNLNDEYDVLFYDSGALPLDLALLDPTNRCENNSANPYIQDSVSYTHLRAPRD